MGDHPQIPDPSPSIEDVRGRLVGDEEWLTRGLAEVRYIVVHHSGRPEDSTPLEIARYHVEALGWPGIGYYWVVSQTGRIYYVGDMETVRANVMGRNREVVGICLPGDFSSIAPVEAQLEQTRWLVERLRQNLPQAELVGHRDIALSISPTSCPGDTWPSWRGVAGGGG